jgi:hypothetical protein
MEAIDELQREALLRILDMLPSTRITQLQASTVVPPSPRAGMIAYASAGGGEWNPGAGQGFYGYYGGAWHFLG